jgi:hypothetical protein
MLLALRKVSGVGEPFLDHGLHSLAACLTRRPVPLKVHIVAALHHVLHLETLLVGQKSLHKVLGPCLLLVFFILEHGLAPRNIHFFAAGQPEDLLIEERSVLVDEAEELIAAFVFGFLFSDVDAGAVAEGKDSFALVVPGGQRVVLRKRQGLLSHLGQLHLDLFEIGTESDNFLQACERGEVVEIGLIVDEEIAHFVGLLVRIFPEENPYPIVQTMHVIITIPHQPT